MKKVVLVFLLLLGPMILSCVTPIAAQEENVKFTWGAVVSVTAQNITIVEYGQGGEEMEVSYQIRSNVELENVKAVTDLKEGDVVDLEYVEEEGKNVVVSIIREEPKIDNGDE